MLKHLLNKKVVVGMIVFQPHQMGSLNPIKYYEGIVVECDENFIMFDNGSMLNVKYIHSIEVK